MGAHASVPRKHTVHNVTSSFQVEGGCVHGTFTTDNVKGAFGTFNGGINMDTSGSKTGGSFDSQGDGNAGGSMKSQGMRFSASHSENITTETHDADFEFNVVAAALTAQSSSVTRLRIKDENVNVQIEKGETANVKAELPRTEACIQRGSTATQPVRLTDHVSLDGYDVRVRYTKDNGKGTSGTFGGNYNIKSGEWNVGESITKQKDNWVGNVRGGIDSRSGSNVGGSVNYDDGRLSAGASADHNIKTQHTDYHLRGTLTGPVGSITVGKTNGGEYAHGYVKKETDKWTATAGGSVDSNGNGNVGVGATYKNGPFSAGIHVDHNANTDDTKVTGKLKYEF